MENKTTDASHKVLAAILLLIAAFIVVALVLVYSQADSVNTQTIISNANPSVDSIFVSDSANGLANDFGSGINLTPGGTTTIYINGVVSDANGATDINTVGVRFFRDTMGTTCGTDYNNCYQNTACVLTSNTDTSKKYNCQIDLWYFTDASDTTGRYPSEIFKSIVDVADKNGGSNGLVSTGAADCEINTLLAVNVPDVIDYGTLTNGTWTTPENNFDMTYEQYGNDRADIQLAAADMPCSAQGTIAAENQKWSLTDVAWDATDTYALSTDGFDTNSDLAYREDDGTATTDSIYMNLYVPYGVVGTCTGTNTVTAIASDAT